MGDLLLRQSTLSPHSIGRRRKTRGKGLSNGSTRRVSIRSVRNHEIGLGFGPREETQFCVSVEKIGTLEDADSPPVAGHGLRVGCTRAQSDQSRATTSTATDNHPLEGLSLPPILPNHEQESYQINVKPSPPHPQVSSRSDFCPGFMSS